MRYDSIIKPSSSRLSSSITNLFTRNRLPQNNIESWAVIHKDSLLRLLQDKDFSDEDQALRLLTEHMNDIDINLQDPPSTGKTALMIAIENRYNTLAQKLIEYGADINILHDTSSNTSEDYEGDEGALYYAVKNKDIDLVTSLMDHGANVRVGFPYKNPLLLAILKNKQVLVKNVLRGINKNDPYDRKILDLAQKIRSDTHERLLDKKGGTKKKKRRMKKKRRTIKK